MEKFGDICPECGDWNDAIDNDGREYMFDCGNCGHSWTEKTA